MLLGIMRTLKASGWFVVECHHASFLEWTGPTTLEQGQQQGL